MINQFGFAGLDRVVVDLDRAQQLRAFVFGRERIIGDVQKIGQDAAADLVDERAAAHLRHHLIEEIFEAGVIAERRAYGHQSGGELLREDFGGGLVFEKYRDRCSDRGEEAARSFRMRSAMARVRASSTSWAGRSATVRP